VKVATENAAVPRSTTLISAFIIIVALYFAREVCIPLALAALLSFLLAPLVVRLRRWGMSRIPAVLVAVGISFVVIGILAALVATQVVDLANDLPNYQRNILNKIRSVSGPSEGIFSQPAQMLRDLSKELTVRMTPTPFTDTPNPVRVEISEPAPTSLEVIKNVLGSMLAPLATAGIVIVFVIFMLIQREDLRDRLIRLIGPSQINVTTQALDDAAGRVSRYLLMQLIINATYGIPVGVGLYFIGIPNPLLWGLLATFLRFIPYVGPAIAAAVPIMLAFAIDPGWTKPLLAIALFVTLELLSNNFMEPWLYGSCTGISATAILAAAVFWTWLWGPIGLLLSTPLTVCLVVLGRYVPHLHFLHVLLGDKPVLTEDARFYQRLLAMDDEEASKIAEDFLKSKPLVDLYDSVIVPALVLAEQDRHHGALDEIRQSFIIQSTRSIIEDLADHRDSATVSLDRRTDPRSLRAGSSGDGSETLLICLPARDEADELAAVMLSQLLFERGIQSKTIPASTLVSERLEVVDHFQNKIVCISAVPPSAVSHARALARQVRTRFRECKLIIGVWNRQSNLAELSSRLGVAQPNAVAATFAEALEQIALMSNVSFSSEKNQPKTNMAGLSQELNSLDGTNAEIEEILNAVTREVAKGFALPLTMVSIVESDEQYWRSQPRMPRGLMTSQRDDREASICAQVPIGNEALFIEDSAKDKQSDAGAALHERGIRFYAGMPLRTQAGRTVGCLCVVDTKARTVCERERILLQTAADKLMKMIEARKSDLVAA
jgi:predicted PurR-regulated permease PerM